MSNRSIIGLIGLAVIIFLLTQTFYTVDPTTQVLVRQFGALVGKPKTEPGLYAKIPLVQDILRIDRRVPYNKPDTFALSTTRRTSSRSLPATRSDLWSTPSPASASTMRVCSPSACRPASRPCVASWIH